MGNALKALIAATVAAAVLPVAAVNATSTETATYSCAQVWGSFNVQLVGDRDWGWNLGALGSVGAPRKKSIIVVWSLGGYAAQQGLNVYSWATGTRSRASGRCKAVKHTARQPSLVGLGPVTRVKDGWAFGRKFGCLEQGPAAAHHDDARGEQDAGGRSGPEERPRDGGRRGGKRRWVDPRLEELRGEGEVTLRSERHRCSGHADLLVRDGSSGAERLE